jgi:hypothetical protein
VIAFKLEIGGFVAIPTTPREATDIEKRDIFEDDLSYSALISCAEATEEIGALEIAKRGWDDVID